MNTRKNTSKILAATVALIPLLVVSLAPAESRGGFRGGGFRGGGFGRGAGGFGGGNRARAPYVNPHGWGNPGARSQVRQNTSSYRSSYRPQVSSAARRTAAGQTYNWSNNRLPTDIAGRRRGVSSQIVAHRTRPVASRQLANHGNSVRRNFAHRDAFRGPFWNRYRNRWWYRGWAGWWAWGYYPYYDYCEYWEDSNCEDKPTEYSYGNNIRYSGNTVYYGSKPAATAEAYFTQAKVLATSVSPSSKSAPKENEWKPMGVFSLTQGDQTNSNTVFQIATNKKGEIRGNYYNPQSDVVKPLQGKIDMKTKRAAWTVGDNDRVVYDTGLANLLSDQSTLLIHYGKDQTQQWDLVRMDKKEGSVEEKVTGTKKASEESQSSHSPNKRS